MVPSRIYVGVHDQAADNPNDISLAQCIEDRLAKCPDSGGVNWEVVVTKLLEQTYAQYLELAGVFGGDAHEDSMWAPPAVSKEMHESVLAAYGRVIHM